MQPGLQLGEGCCTTSNSCSMVRILP